MPKPDTPPTERKAAKRNHSAGIVLFRRSPELRVLLVHPGGPFWANKDEHGWSIPKGEFDPATEDPEAAAVREFGEETGQPVPDGPRIALEPFKAGRKTISAWLVEGDLDPAEVTSNLFEMEWPPRSGSIQEFPEVDRADWFTLDECQTKLHKGQVPICELISAAIDP